MIYLKIWNLVLMGAKKGEDGKVVGWKYVTNDTGFKEEVIIDKDKLEDFIKVVEDGKLSQQLWKQLRWARGDFVNYGKQDKQDV